MAGRHSMRAVVLFAVILHAIAISQTLLPAQDGLKFIRIAREFHIQPWADVVRGSDVHPLYPALIAAVEPVVAIFAGEGPGAWRAAAQLVAGIASVALIFPVFALTRLLFDRRIACIAAALAVLLPRAAELGHDTLSDSLGLLGIFASLWLGALALRRRDWRVAAGSGLVAGAGYLARPEVILVPLAIGLTWILGLVLDRQARVQAGVLAMAVLAVCTGAFVVSYALVKGEISEKLAVRMAASLGPPRAGAPSRTVPQRLPSGLDDPRWDFSPKEEADLIPIPNSRIAVVRIIGKWWEELCWFFAVMTVWGLVRQRHIRTLCPGRDRSDAGLIERRLIFIFSSIYLAALLRHSVLLGYLSGRHVLACVYASLPWAAAGSFVCARGLAAKLCWSRRVRLGAGVLAALVLVAASIVVQMQPRHLNHLSRWGHWAAGRWLAENATRNELVLDTRGWARFISDHPGYDYWHVRQALTDSHLSYIVVGLDELRAQSPRARTLNALLAYSATPIVTFPGLPGDRGAGVRLYRFHQPESWQGLAP